MGSKYKHKCPDNRETKGDWTCTQVMRAKRQRLECCGHKPRNAGSHKKLGKSSNGIFPRVSGERLADALILASGILAYWERIYFCCFEPPVWC